MTLNLTDGTNSVKAIEHRHIPSLNQADMLPGTKIILRGQINYFNQTLHLNGGNIQVLGGQVAELATIEHLIGVLQNMMYVGFLFKNF